MTNLGEKLKKIEKKSQTSEKRDKLVKNIFEKVTKKTKSDKLVKKRHKLV